MLYFHIIYFSVSVTFFSVLLFIFHDFCIFFKHQHPHFSLCNFADADVVLQILDISLKFTKIEVLQTYECI